MANRKLKKAVSTKPRTVMTRFRPYAEIEGDLNRVKCTLACASIALGEAESLGDDDLAAQAGNVIHQCVGRLSRVENDLDAWHVAHEHSTKEVGRHA